MVLRHDGARHLKSQARAPRALNGARLGSRSAVPRRVGSIVGAPRGPGPDGGSDPADPRGSRGRGPR